MILINSMDGVCFVDSFSRAEVNIRVEDVNDNPPAPKSNETLELTLCENLGKNQASDKSAFILFKIIDRTEYSGIKIIKKLAPNVSSKN